MAGVGSGNGFDFPLLPKIDVSDTSITLGDTAIMAGDVTFLASSSSLHATTSAPDGTNPVAVQTGINFLENFSLIGAIADSTANTTINLGAGVAVTVSSFTAMAAATSDAKAEPAAIKLGASIAIVNTRATLTAAGHITTTGNTALDAGAINTLMAKANAGGNLGGAGRPSPSPSSIPVRQRPSPAPARFAPAAT